MKKLLLAFICLQSVFIFGQAPAIQWQKSLGGAGVEYGTEIQQTADGGYIVVGQSNSNDGDVAGNHGNGDYWVVKLDALGDITWQRSLGGTGDDQAYSIQQTSDGGYIVAGRSNSTNGDVTGNHGDYDYWIVKLDDTGNIIWQKSFGGTGNEWGISVQQTSDGGYIVAGYSNSTNGNITGNHGGYDYWIVKLDVNGNIIWQKSLGGTGTDQANSIQQTVDGGYIVAGRSNSTNGDVTGNHGHYDGWIVKLDASGNIIWQKSLGGTEEEQTRSIQQTSDGGYIVAGFSLSNNGDVTGNMGQSDYWIIKLDLNGNIIWEKSYGGTMNDFVYSIQLTTNGNYIVSGYSNSNDGDVTVNHGDYDYWIVKLGDCSPVTSTITETACSSFTWTAGNGQTYTSSTTATHTIIGGATNGCDSTITLNLTINQPTMHTIIVTACESYTLNAQTYTSSGTYTQTLTNSNNCDSTITLNLTINQPTTHTITATACGSYALNSQMYTSSGTYTQTLTNTNNCDSTITLNLTINNVDNTVSVSGITLTATQTAATYQWIDCDNGNIPISGAIAQSFTPTSNGNYAVEVTANGCMETSNCIAINSVGIESLEQNGWSVYPNPGKGIFTVKGESLSNNMTVKVMNALGQTIKGQTTVSNGTIMIDLTDEPTGVYLLEIDNTIVKLIKQ